MLLFSLCQKKVTLSVTMNEAIIKKISRCVCVGVKQYIRTRVKFEILFLWSICSEQISRCSHCEKKYKNLDSILEKTGFHAKNISQTHDFQRMIVILNPPTWMENVQLGDARITVQYKFQHVYTQMYGSFVKSHLGR